MMQRWTVAKIVCAGALLAAVAPHLPLGISRAAAAGQGSPTAVACGSLVDATGGKVSDQVGGEQVATSTLRRCPAPSAPKPAPRVADVARPAQTEAVPGLSAQSTPRPVSPQEDPLRFAAENPERIGAALLTGGAMIWALHSSFLSWLLVLGLPLWRHVDVLPILAAAAEVEAHHEPAAPPPEEAAVAQILDAQRRQGGSDSQA